MKSLSLFKASRMTTFLGNALRGSFFLIFGLWWSIKYPMKYALQKLNTENKASRLLQFLDITEGMAKAFFALGGKFWGIMSSSSVAGLPTPGCQIPRDLGQSRRKSAGMQCFIVQPPERPYFRQLKIYIKCNVCKGFFSSSV